MCYPKNLITVFFIIYLLFYCRGRKMNSNLEAAIHEALIELDRQASMMQIDKDSVAKKKKIK